MGTTRLQLLITMMGALAVEDWVVEQIVTRVLLHAIRLFFSLLPWVDTPDFQLVVVHTTPNTAYTLELDNGNGRPLGSMSYLRSVAATLNK